MSRSPSMRRHGAIRRLLPGAIALTFLAGCAAGARDGDPLAGEKLFTGKTPIASTRGTVPACAGCHGITPDGRSPLGPSLWGVADRARTRVRGMTATEYLRQSVLDPDAVLVDNYQEGIMFRGYRDSLSEQQIADLVAYLLTLSRP